MFCVSFVGSSFPPSLVEMWRVVDSRLVGKQHAWRELPWHSIGFPSSCYAPWLCHVIDCAVVLSPVQRPLFAVLHFAESDGHARGRGGER